MPGKTRRELERLDRLIAQGADATPADYRQWRDSCVLAVEAIYGSESSQVEDFGRIPFTRMVVTSSTTNADRWTATQRGIDRALDMLKAFAEDVRFSVEAPEAPAIDPGALHPWVAGPAAELWRDGHHRQAVQEAARAVDQRLQLLVGDYASGASLMTEAFSPKAPILGRARLRFVAYSEGSDAWKSAHAGAGQFGAGCMMRIRNLYVHNDDPSDQEALEALAALSLLARWIASATVVSVDDA